MPRLVGVDGHQAGDAAPLLELAADQVARALRRDHPDVDARRRRDLVEVDREAVGEHEQVALGDPVGDLALPDLRLLLVGEQDHHHVAAAGGVGDVEDLEALRLGLGAAGGVGPQADDDVDPGLLQVERVGVALRAVAEDRDRLAHEGAEGGVVLVDHVAVGHLAFPGGDRRARLEDDERSLRERSSRPRNRPCRGRRRPCRRPCRDRP